MALGRPKASVQPGEFGDLRRTVPAVREVCPNLRNLIGVEFAVEIRPSLPVLSLHAMSNPPDRLRR